MKWRSRKDCEKSDLVFNVETIQILDHESPGFLLTNSRPLFDLTIS